MYNLISQTISRIGQGILVLWGVVTIVFSLRYLYPGDPAVLIAPTDANEELIAEIRASLGLDRPLLIQYVDFLFNMLQGDLGYSYVSNIAVTQRIGTTIFPTIELAFTSLVFALLLSIPLGVIAARNRGSRLDSGSNVFSLIGVSTPNFWLAIMLVLLLSVELGLLPTSGRPVGFTQALSQLFFQLDISGLITWTSHIILPTVALGTYFMALIYRMTRNNVIENINEDYVMAAHGKGLPESEILYQYVLRNSISPVITVAGLQLGLLIGGSVVVEIIFSWPGVGALFITALSSQDWPTIQGILITVGAGYVTINMIVDIINAKITPRTTQQ